MNFMLMGHAQHGKGTACAILERVFGLKAISSSQFANQKFLFDRLAPVYGYKSLEECFNDRHDKRQEWYQLIYDYNTPNRTRLAGELFSTYDVYDGIRSRDELLAIKEATLVDHYIWIDASERKPKESPESITVTEADADIVISNNGTPEQFEATLIALFKSFGLKEV